jgi:hypothetical protein
MLALRFGARTRSSKDNRFRPAEGMNGRDPDERLFSKRCGFTHYQVSRIGATLVSPGTPPPPRSDSAETPPCDGTRTHRQIARELSRTAGMPSARDVRRYLPASLDWLARMALLEG